MSDPGNIPPGNSSDWLPSGWKVEVRSNNGKNVKSYVDQQTGYRFYSKPKVLEYLRTQQNYSWRSQYETPGTRYDNNLPQNLNETSGLLPHRSATETPCWENGSQSGSFYEPVASESMHSVGTRAEKSPDWLPSGWTEEVKIRDGHVVKTYVDPLWGHRFYTKPQVLQYLGVVTNDSSSSQKETASNNSESKLVEKMSGKAEPLLHASTSTTPWENGSQSKRESSEMPHSEKIMSEKKPDWLPTGWAVEVNIRNGRTYKSFVDPLTERRFYSKPKVLEYLGNANIDGGMSEKKKMGNDFDINLPVGINDTLESLHHVRISETETGENDSLTEKSLKLPPKIIDNSRQLPDGWIIEVKTGKNGSVSYKSAKRYVDPVTGRKFNSKTKVFEYLESVKFNNTTFQQNDMLNVIKTDDATPPPQRVESQDVKTLIDTIHLAIAEETSSRKRPGRKQPNVDKAKRATPPRLQAESQNAETLREAIILSTPNETTFRNRRGKMPNVDKPGGETPLAQPVESQNVKTPNRNDLFTSKEISSGKQAERQLPIGLPPGFKTEIKMKKTGNKTKKLAYYIDPVSGYVFSSKADTWRYIEAGNISKCVIKPKKREEMGFAAKCNSPNVDKPDGETPPAQPVESQNVKTPNHNNLFTSQEISSGKQPVREIPRGLPPGFIAEIKMKKTGNKTKKMPYYIDPVSGYVFRSIADTWRYIEAGNINRCVIKPKKKEEMGFATKCSSPKVDNVGSNTSLQLLKEPAYVNMRKRTRFSAEVENFSSSKECDSEVVIERVAAEGLPNGWIKEVKTEKFYTDPRSGFVFMSQKDALRYLETGDIGTCAVKPRSRDELGLNKESTPKMNKTGGETSLLHLEQSQNENAPRRTRLSSKQKEMSSSKPPGREVVERVTPMKGDMIQKKTIVTSKYTPKIDKTRENPALQQLKHSQPVNVHSAASFSSPEKEVTPFKHNGIETTLVKVAPTGLPPGWIKEVRIQKRAEGIRKDTFCTDPVSGYVFSSMKDVFRYVETGDIMNCAMRPKKREAYGFGQGNFTTSPAVVQSPGSMKQMSTGKKVGTKRSFEAMDSAVSETRRQIRSILERDSTRKQLSTGNVSSIRSSQTMDPNVQQERRQTRSVATPVAMQKLGSHTTEKQFSTVNIVGTERDISQKRQTRTAAVSPAVVKPLHDSAKKQSSTGKRTGSKRSLETMDSDVPQKRRQTRASASIVSTPTPIIELPKEVPKIKDVIQKPRMAEKGSGSNGKLLPKTKVIERTENLKVKNVRSPPSAKNSKVKSVKKNATKTNSCKKTQSSASQTKKKETKKEIRTPPSRVSKRISGINTARELNLESIEQVPVYKVQTSSQNKFIKKSCQKEGIPCPDDPESVASSEQTRTSEAGKSAENENNFCPTAADIVAENIPRQLETIPETGNIEVEKSGQNEDKTCLNASSDIFGDAPRELENVSEMGITDIALGGAEALSNGKASNKSNESVKDQVEDRPISQEQPMEIQAEDQTVSEERPCGLSNKNKEAMEDQIVPREQHSELSNKDEALDDQTRDQPVPQEQHAEDQTVSEERPCELSNKNKEAMEDQTVPTEQHSELSNKNEALDDQTRDQPILQEQHSEVANKREEAMENQIGKKNVSQELLSESSDKSEDANFFESEDAISDQIEDQTISPEQSTKVSNKEAMKNQTISQEQPNEGFNSRDAIEDQSEDKPESQEQSSEVSNKSKDAMKDQSVSQDEPMYQFGEESWSDPCLDFAFKTLTGTLPFEENVPVPNIFQARGDTSQLKTSDDSLTMLDFGGSSDRQVDNSDTKNGSEAPASDISLPDMNRSLPSGSQNGPQQNEWEENKNNEKNELTLDNYARYLF